MEKKKKVSKTGIVLTAMIIVVIACVAIIIKTTSSAPMGGRSGGRPGGAPTAQSSESRGEAPTGGDREAKGGAKESAGQMSRGGQNQNVSETIYAVRVETAEYSNLQDYIKLNGDIITSTTVDIYPDTSGKLSTLHVSLGDYVVKGETIAEIDPSLPGQVFSTSPVKSTITGTITDLPYRVGSTISSTQIPLASVGDLTDLQVQVYVSESDIALIKNGLDAEITFDAYPDAMFNAVITEISPVLNKSSRTMEVKLSITENDSRIKSGMFASVKLITDVISGALTVTTECVTESGDDAYVYITNQDDTVSKTIVETGLEIDGLVEIRSGLNPGDNVVNRGQGMIQDGSTVRISK